MGSKSSMTGVCIKVRDLDQRHREGKSRVKMGARIRVIQLQARNATDCCHHQRLKETGTDSVQSLQEGHGPADTLTLDFWPQEL